jgi:hypothetical protein
MRLNRRRFSGTIEMPISTRCWVGSSLTRWLSRKTSPADGTTNPRMVFSVVVLPLALPPSRHTISPG